MAKIQFFSPQEGVKVGKSEIFFLVNAELVHELYPTIQ